MVTQVNTTLTVRHQSVVGISTVADQPSLGYVLDLPSGPSDSQADQVYHYSGSVASSATSTFDLNGSLTDVFGVVATFSTVRLVAIANDSTVGSLAIGGASNGVVGLGRVVVPPGGYALIAGPVTGWPVGAGADEIAVAVATGAAAISYRLLVVGCK